MARPRPAPVVCGSRWAGAPAVAPPEDPVTGLSAAANGAARAANGAARATNGGTRATNGGTPVGGRRVEGAARLLGTVSLFADLDEAKLQDLARHAVRVPFRARAILSAAHRKGAGLSVLRHGAAKVCTAERQGRAAILALLGPGDYFGELCVLPGVAGSTPVRALRGGELLHIPAAVFARLLDERPPVLERLLRDTAGRIRRAQEAIRRLALEDVRGRVTQVLRQLAEEEGEPCAEGVWIERRPSQQLLAGMAGSTRETVSRVLKELEARSCIVSQGRRVLLRHGAWNGAGRGWPGPGAGLPGTPPPPRFPEGPCGQPWM